MAEIWKDVVGYEGLYQVSSEGVVKSLITNRFLSPTFSQNGYGIVCLCYNGDHKYCSVHRLVAETFIPNPENLPTVDHINRNKRDNRIENLRWASWSTQILNREVDYSKRNRKYTKGGKHHNARQVICVETGEVFPCIKDAADYFGINASNLGYVCRGERLTCGGYHWRYA